MDQQILRILEKHGALSLDELATHCHGAGWSAVFLAVDRLSRSGQVLLELTGRGKYRIKPFATVAD